MEENKFWKQLSIEMEKVSLRDIVNKQNEINADSDKFTISSQVFQRQLAGDNYLYDALIYYKIKPEPTARAREKTQAHAGSSSSAEATIKNPITSEQLDKEIFR